MAWAPDYVTTAELKTLMRVTDSDDDATLALAISAASRAVDRFAGRQFGLVAAAETRQYTAEWDRRRCRWVVFFDDLSSPAVTGLTVTVEAGAIDSYDLKPANATAVSLPYTHLVVDTASTHRPLGTEDEVSMTARWGWNAVPDAVKEATTIQALRFFKRKDAPFGVAGSPDLGSELRLLAKVDPDVAVMLGPYTRWWAAV